MPFPYQFGNQQSNQIDHQQTQQVETVSYTTINIAKFKSNSRSKYQLLLKE